MGNLDEIALHAGDDEAEAVESAQRCRALRIYVVELPKACGLFSLPDRDMPSVQA